METEVQEVGLSAKEIHDAAKQSIDMLAALALPTQYKYAFPDLYIAAWQWLGSYVSKVRDFSQLALGLPRGFAKTTFIKLFILYVILFTSKRFILVCAETDQKAALIIEDVFAMLEEQNIVRVFGDWRLGTETNQIGFKKFGYRGRVIAIKGSTVDKVRGLNIENERPDIMIFDDIQSRIHAESQIQSETIEREMYGTAMKAKSPHGCLFIFVGNMYPTKYSILRKLINNSNWLKFIVGGVLSDGTSLWEELQPIAQLMKELENDIASGHPEIFVSEVLNDPNAQANNLIDLSRLPEWRVSEGDIPMGSFVIIDPSNDKANSDAVSIGYFEVHNEYPHMMKHTEGRLSPLETIRTAVQYCMESGCRLVAIESVAAQATYLFWARWFCTQYGIDGIQFVEVYPGGLSKTTRILTMFKAYQKGEIFVHERCRTAVHLQITQYNIMKRDNVDGLLDLLAYAPKVMEEYGAYIESMNLIQIQEHNNLPVVLNNSPF